LRISIHPYNDAPTPGSLRSVGIRGTVIVVTDRHLYPVLQGNQARIVQLVRSLRAAGYRVTLLIRKRRGRLGIPAPTAHLPLPWLADRVRLIGGDRFGSGDPRAIDLTAYRQGLSDELERELPVAVIAEYIWMAPVLDVAPGGILKVVDTHDVMWRRREIYAGSRDGAWVETSQKIKAKLLSHNTAILAIQGKELEMLREMVPDRQVLHVPHSPEPPRRRWWRNQSATGVLFVGSRNESNVVAVREFIREAWPRVCEAVPGARLRVVGTAVDWLTPATGVDLVGPVRSLDAEYARAAVVINPVRLGTGLKIKTVEALVAGRALVTTSCGAEGLEDGAGTAFHLAADTASFGEALVRLLTDPHERIRLERGSTAYAAMFTARAAIRPLVEAIEVSKVGGHGAGAQSPDGGSPRVSEPVR